MNKDLMKALGFAEEVKNFESGNCPMCKTKIDMSNFKDALSVKEYSISGLCQVCQDKFFK